MRYRILALVVLMMGSAGTVRAQTPDGAKPEAATPSLQDRLMPEATTSLMAPASAKAEAPETAETTLNMQRRGSGTGLMIAGGALFVAGLIVGGDAGTVLAVTGAAVGAYGLYLYFR